MVMPHSALAAGQYEKWREGSWAALNADLTREPWDLEQLEPNDFFPVPACVVFASKRPSPADISGMARHAQQWRGAPGGSNTRERVVIRVGVDSKSPYHARAHQGATIVPRRLFFVEAAPSPTSLVANRSVVTPVRSSQEKEPWRSLLLPELENTHVSDDYIHKVHRGDTIAPFVCLEPKLAVLPLAKSHLFQERTAESLPWPTRSALADLRKADVYLERLSDDMRYRWKHMRRAWETNKSPSTALSLIGQIDYLRKLSSQLPLHPIRLVYGTSGRPTAAILHDKVALIDSRLYWVACESMSEAKYLSAIVNSECLLRKVEPLMSKGQYGPRDVHKHLWRLPIPEFEPGNGTHEALVTAGKRAADQALLKFDALITVRAAKGMATSAVVARNRLRQWLSQSEIGQEIEELVNELLG